MASLASASSVLQFFVFACLSLSSFRALLRAQLCDGFKKAWVMFSIFCFSLVVSMGMTTFRVFKFVIKSVIDLERETRKTHTHTLFWLCHLFVQNLPMISLRTQNKPQDLFCYTEVPNSCSSLLHLWSYLLRILPLLNILQPCRPLCSALNISRTCLRTFAFSLPLPRKLFSDINRLFLYSIVTFSRIHTQPHHIKYHHLLHHFLFVLFILLKSPLQKF